MAVPYVLVLYYSRTHGTKNLAMHIARGIDQVAGIDACIRTVPEVDVTTESIAPPVPEEGAVFCTKKELADCAGLAIGSATRFGNMAAPLKHFLDTTADLWVSRKLVGKPACLFASSNSLHGGQESTLLSMMIPLMHHGMLIQPLPYSEPALNETTSGGTPYGVTHVAANGPELSAHEAALAVAQGAQIARLALQLL